MPSANRSKRIEEIRQMERNMDKFNCSVERRFGPKRNIIFQRRDHDDYQRKNAIIGDSIVFGIYDRDAVTISCPGGTVQSLVSGAVLRDLKAWGVEKIAVMVGTNSLFANSDNSQVMTPLMVRDEIEYLVRYFRFEGFDVTVLSLIAREGKWSTIRRLNRYLREMCLDESVYFHRVLKFQYKRHICADGIHPKASATRDLARDFRAALGVIQSRTYDHTINSRNLKPCNSRK